MNSKLVKVAETESFVCMDPPLPSDPPDVQAPPGYNVTICRHQCTIHCYNKTVKLHVH